MVALFNIQMDRRQKTVAAIAQTWVKPTSSGPRQTHYRLIKSFVAKRLDFVGNQKLDFEKQRWHYSTDFREVSPSPV